MKVTKMFLMILFITAVSGMAGCKFVDDPIPLGSGFAISLAPAPRLESAPQNDPAIASRFTTPNDETIDVVKSALMWSKRYEELSVKTEKLREKNNALMLENTDLKDQLSKLQTQLDQTMSELDDANKFLQDLQLELTRWKSDVIGFRDEIRDAQAAQLQALGKIMKVLGAESTVPEPKKN